MFKNSVNSTMLTSDAADIFFQNITGQKFGSDHTFLATLRALVAPRIPEGESVYLYFGRSDYNSEVVSQTSAKRMVDMICSGMSHGSGQVYVHNLANRDEASNIANIELLKRQFCEVYAGWHCLEKISVFYQKSFKVVCFINPEFKSVALFVDQLTLQKLHYLQMSTLAFMPWYFSAEQGMDEVELAMVKSLRERSSEKWEHYIAELAKRYDFESSRIKHLLADFESKYERMEHDRVKRDIAQIDRNIRELDDRFARFIKQRNDMCIRLLGLERRLEEGGPSELMDYFLCNRSLYLENVNDTSMSFAVRDYLSYFDEDAAQTYINNKSGYFYRACSTDEERDGMKKLLNAIFVDQTIRIRFCAAYYFDLNGSVSANDSHDFGVEFNGYRPNPHIDNYSCMGNYARTINNALAKRDYITALEQCVASAKSLNFHDGIVMSTFASQFSSDGGTSYKALELPDGTIVSPKEAIAWIKSQESAAKADVGEGSETDSASRINDIPDDVAERAAAAN